MSEAWDLNRGMFLSVGEVERLLSRVSDSITDKSGRELDAARLDELIVTALVLSGLRNSEFCGLRLGDVRTGNGRAAALVVRRRGAVSRTVQVPRRVSSLIARYIEDTRPRFLPDGARADDPGQRLVFNEHRRPYERSGLYRRVVRILSEAGLGDRASVQLLRHTYGYLAYLRTGGNLLFVQRQLGHAHPRITSVYAQFVEESYAEMAERVAAPFDEAGHGLREKRYAQSARVFDCETD